jgi:hypothetical protein
VSIKYLNLYITDAETRAQDHKLKLEASLKSQSLHYNKPDAQDLRLVSSLWPTTQDDENRDWIPVFELWSARRIISALTN